MSTRKLAQQLPGGLDWEIFKPDEWRWRISIVDENDASEDLTEYDITATVHPKDGDDIELAIEETNLASGTFEIVMTSAQHATLAVDDHSYCVVLTPNGGGERTYLAGKLFVKGCE